jgi:AcrR family transcriptional regulator
MPTTRHAPDRARRESPARRRILDTAGRLFYGEGIRAVGVDRIIAEAGVAKATFYSHFPAKDDLVCAYLAEQNELQHAAALAVRARDMPPREMILTVFEAIGELGCGPGFRGCPFINAAAEYPDPRHPVRRIVAEYRTWFRELLRDLLHASAQPEAERTVAMLMLVRDGLVVGGQLDDADEIRDLVRATVTSVLDAAA